MGSFVLGGVTFGNLFKKPATKMYPVVAPTYTAMTKGSIVNDIEACSLCSICAKKCPSLAINVDKPGKTWEIDPFACIQCYTCVRACPKDCLTMLAQYTAPSTTKEYKTLVKTGGDDEKAVAAAE
ncbi:MAG: 4Fe-4S dicluster domain-containing protein [Actinomycetia bacterium]|nr:4Fe-4S dicluster domain-containing protein [Actinomycetes bacterium]